MTPLNLAANYHGGAEVARLLLKAGADPTIPDGIPVCAC
jgi:hypothetical protein